VFLLIVITSNLAPHSSLLYALPEGRLCDQSYSIFGIEQRNVIGYKFALARMKCAVNFVHVLSIPHVHFKMEVVACCNCGQDILVCYLTTLPAWRLYNVVKGIFITKKKLTKSPS
jgi:hypothetical protein